MTFTTVSSILLIFMTPISYIPQYNRLITIGTSAGISLTSTLLNTLVTQAQAANMYYLFKTAPAMEYNVPIASPPIARDWLNLTQVLVQWACSLILFGLVVKLPTSSNSFPIQAGPSFGYERVGKEGAVALWLSHVLLSILSIVAGGRRQDVIFNIIRNINFDVVNPIVTILAITAPMFQASVSSPSPVIGALSKTSLLLQSATFGFLAISWPFRLKLPPNMWHFASTPAVITAWFPWVGWACVNSGVAAVGQGALWLVVRGLKDGDFVVNGEARHLLSS